jgi:hypothetical protein
VRPNVVPRSNVAPRDERHFTDDILFLSKVRGRAAVMQILEAFGYSRSLRASDPAARALVQRHVLTENQLVYLEEDAICNTCDRLPVGIDFNGRKAFRCDRPDCR